MTLATQFGMGIERGQTWRVFAESADFVAIEVPGHHFWRGIGQAQGYAAREVVIVSKVYAARGWTETPVSERPSFSDPSTKRLREKVRSELEARQRAYDRAVVR